jgi:peptide deformylase
VKLKIKYIGNPILREQALEVKEITEEIRELVAKMILLMDELRGVGLAATQVGYLYRIFVIRPEVKTEDGEFALGEPEVYINPVLKNPSKETEVMAEGCLSVPGIHADVERPLSIDVEAIDLEERRISKRVCGFKAREIMHENDHLHGKLFIDRLKEKDRKAVEKELEELKEKLKDF